MINVTRDVAAPDSLLLQKSYRNKDVIDLLFRIFKGKCYLTESLFNHPEEMEIDHFVTQSEDAGKIYDWTNLYPISQRANKQRPKSTPEGGYLDPCNSEDDVEKEIVYVVEFGGNALFKARNPQNIKAVNTAKLLNNLHKDLKPAIKDKHHEIVNAVAEWYNARNKIAGQQDSSLTESTHKTLLTKELLLKKLLSRESHFTMLMRSIEAVENLPPDFFD